MKELMDTLGPVPQSEPIPGREAEMAENNAGGYAFAIDKWTQLDRFLMIGTAEGTYYVEQRELTKENAAVVKACIEEDGSRAVNRIFEISHEGRAPKNDQAIFALAMCVSHGDEITRKLAWTALPDVCRIGTHLLMFVAFVKQMRGFGRAARRAIGDWYTEKQIDRVAEQVTKYRNRHNWTHRDVLRLIRPKGDDLPGPYNDLFRWITRPDDYEIGGNTARPLAAFLALQKATDSVQAAELITAHRWLSHEMVPTELKDARVWQALLKRGMGLTALMRNLPTMTRLGLLTPLSDNVADVQKALVNAEALKRQRLHPISLLLAHKTYNEGKSVRGKATWEPTQAVSAAIEEAFYLAFDTVEKIDKRVYVGLDVSGSMTWGNLCGVPGFMAIEAGAALAVCYARQFSRAAIFGFANDPSGDWSRYRASAMRDLKIGPKTGLREALNNASRMAFGGTDCALPMRHALADKIEADAFVIITDNETWAGDVHPAEALRQYRKAMGIDAKLVVCGMTSTGFSIADPKDGGMFDVVGFDTAVPRLIEDFLR